MRGGARIHTETSAIRFCNLIDMAKRRRSRSKNPPLPKAAEVVAFSEAEKAFFAVGDDSGMLAQSAVAQISEHHDEPRPSLWRRLFARTQRT